MPRRGRATICRCTRCCGSGEPALDEEKRSAPERGTKTRKWAHPGSGWRTPLFGPSSREVESLSALGPRCWLGGGGCPDFTQRYASSGTYLRRKQPLYACPWRRASWRQSLPNRGAFRSRTSRPCTKSVTLRCSTRWAARSEQATSFSSPRKFAKRTSAFSTISVRTTSGTARSETCRVLTSARLSRMSRGGSSRGSSMPFHPSKSRISPRIGRTSSPSSLGRTFGLTPTTGLPWRHSQSPPRAH